MYVAPSNVRTAAGDIASSLNIDLKVVFTQIENYKVRHRQRTVSARSK